MELFTHTQVTETTAGIAAEDSHVDEKTIKFNQNLIFFFVYPHEEVEGGFEEWKHLKFWSLFLRDILKINACLEK